MARYVYGPVPSRRLGRSLGVDLVPLKTCSFNCIYCQLGPTPATTIQRAEYAPAREVAEEVRQRLAEGVPVDYVTLGGSGEPTLNSAFGDVARRIKTFADVPVALLTNGSLFYLPEVRAACEAVDVVIPDLDAGDEETFQRINRPHAGLTLDKVVGGLVALRDEFPGEIWLEVFLVPGVNTSDADVQKLTALIERIRPDRIDLNMAVRPPAEDFVRPVPASRLEEIRAMVGPKARIVADASGLPHDGEVTATEAQVLEMLRRRPCTVEDIASGMSVPPQEARKHVQRLLAQERIVEQRRGTRTYYAAR